MWSYASRSTRISSVESKYLVLHSIWLVRPRYLFPIGGKSQVLSRCLNVPMCIYWGKHRSKRLHQCDQVNKSHLCTLLGRRQSKKEGKKGGGGIKTKHGTITAVGASHCCHHCSGGRGSCKMGLGFSLQLMPWP